MPHPSSFPHERRKKDTHSLSQPYDPMPTLGQRKHADWVSLFSLYPVFPGEFFSLPGIPRGIFLSTRYSPGNFSLYPVFPGEFFSLPGIPRGIPGREKRFIERRSYFIREKDISLWICEVIDYVIVQLNL